MKKLLLSLFTLSLLNSANAQWISQGTSTITNNLFSVFAISPTAVAATGFTGAVKSLNAGSTWSQNVSLGGVNTFEIHTKHPTKWYFLTQNNTWFVRLGFASSSLSSGKPSNILSLHFIDQKCAIAVGSSGTITATCDTGATWSPRTSGTTNNLNAVWFADKDSGCAVGVSGTILRTIDAGATWTNVVSGTGLSLNAIHFTSPTVGYIAGNGGKVLKSTDAGTTWTNMPTGVLNTLNGVYFVDKDTGYVVGSGGLIMKTINGGVNWYTMMSGTTQMLNSVHFATQVDGWAVGNAGTILKYNGSPALGLNNTNAETHFSFFPNPAKDLITINTAVRTASIRLFTSLGQLVYEDVAKDEETKIDVSNFVAGVYFIECRTEDNVTVKRFVKE